MRRSTARRNLNKTQVIAHMASTVTNSTPAKTNGLVMASHRAPSTSPSSNRLADTLENGSGEVLMAARAVVQPGDTLLACAGHSVNIALLPQVTWTGPLANLWQDTVQDDVVALCEPYLLTPPAGDGARWAVVAARRPDSPDPKAQQNFTRLWSLVNQPTWEIVWRNDRAVLAKAR